ASINSSSSLGQCSTQPLLGPKRLRSSKPLHPLPHLVSNPPCPSALSLGSRRRCSSRPCFATHCIPAAAPDRAVFHMSLKTLQKRRCSLFLLPRHISVTHRLR
ncbi:uncharacterized protein SCHCODRAFT_02316496, partial [Schizophyllum commune H4-8]|uniref:uncharacterized protein n=1 Tax=Schizophyllum commune (strain H4-8 / FGSC 9210) TaxID=578458 RepID=UPI00215E61E8